MLTARIEKVIVEAVLLDFDGVVANVNIRRALEAAAKYRSFFTLPAEQLLDQYFYHNPKNCALDLGLTTTMDVRQEMMPSLWTGTAELWHQWWQDVEDAYEISEEMSLWLSRLSEYFSLGLVTDNHIGFRDWLASRPDIGGHFATVVCSAEYGIKKPSLTLFEEACAQLATDLKATVYIDDDINNVEAAQELGLRSIHFQSLEQVQRVFADFLA